MYLLLQVGISPAFMFQEGKIITFGGVDNVAANSRTDLVQTCYICIPSLRQMAWDAINFYFDLESMDSVNLVCNGIPRDLVSNLS